MKYKIKLTTQVLLIICILIISGYKQPSQKKELTTKEGIAETNPLASWNDGSTKKAIIDFINKTTKEGSADFIPVADRIACFDNDGTLWSEQPMYFQLAFALDRVKALAPQYPEWKTTQPFKALLEGDLKTALAGGEKAVFQIIMATHAGMTTTEFEKTVKDWMATATHPNTKKHYQ